MLYDSEINFALSCFWDGGFWWKLGDRANGYPAEGHADNAAAAIEALKLVALKQFPESEFTQKMRAMA